MDESSKSLLKQFIRKLRSKIFNRIFRRSAEHPVEKMKSEQPSSVKKAHPWRICPMGKHWVVTHPLWIPPTEKRPGYTTSRDGHCATNPRHKNGKIVQDYLSTSEMQLIAEKYFETLTGPPTSGKLPHKNADKYDEFIRGWTKYWNDIFKPKEPLDPDLVKALIASESSFILQPPEQNAGAAGKARGLIQLTDQAVEALGNTTGELTNHLVEFKTKDANDPNLSVAAGTRWLFRKKDLAAHRLKREASWNEAVAEYKGYLRDMLSGKTKIQMEW